MAIVTILGAGMMGAALGVPLADRGHTVRLVGTHLDTDIVASMQRDGRHPKLNRVLPDSIEVFSHQGLTRAMAGCEVAALGVSFAGIEWACERLAPLVRPDLPIFMITKGLHFDGEALQVLPDLVAQRLRRACPSLLAPAAIAGPCIAGELARRQPSCVVLTGRDEAVVARLRALLVTDYYHVWPSADVTGVEVCAALKNAYAMAVAFGAGLHQRHGGAAGSVAMHNLESAVFAQALFEMRQLVRRLGGEEASVAGLAGAGDLDVTNNGGRTGRFGRLLGQGFCLDEAITRMQGATLECLDIIAVMRQAMTVWQRQGALSVGQLPLLRHLAEVALDGAPVRLPFAAFFNETGASAC